MGIEETIALMQKNPKMFVQEERIDYIFYFLDGGCAVMQSDDIERHFTCWFGKWLIEFHTLPKQCFGMKILSL